MKSVFARGPAKLEVAIMPLIDVCMLLIVFFALVSQIGITDFVKMNLPKPTPTAAVPPRNEPRLVINAISDGEGAVTSWRFSSSDYSADPEGVKQLSDAVASALRGTPASEVHLRADSNVKYSFISPVLDQVGRAATAAVPGRAVRLRLAVQPERRGG
ncbi:MAG: biopolymer transporter ExbD [Planctomycetes bacterium]|nr:biopolymer transporter ExbD [Planctomycetota bacterium]